MALDAFTAVVKVMNHTGIYSPDTLCVLPTRFASMARSAGLESTVLALPNHA